MKNLHAFKEKSDKFTENFQAYLNKQKQSLAQRLCELNVDTLHAHFTVNILFSMFPMHPLPDFWRWIK